MTNVYECHNPPTTVEEDRVIAAEACVVDDGDTSFEIDEPEDEEVIIMVGDIGDGRTMTRTVAKDGITQSSHDPHKTTAVATSTSSPYTVPLVSIRSGGGEGDDPGEQTDSSIESHTGSSTPTTADVADCCATTVAVAVSPSYSVKVKRLSPLQYGKFAASNNNVSPHQQQQQQHSQANSSITEDNISGSINTTTTEMDLDGITSISPNTARILAVRAALQTTIMPQQQTPLNVTATTVGHPSAAFLQTDAAPHSTTVTGESSNSSSQQHRRNLSSSSHRSMGSAHPSLPSVKSHKVYDWIRWICLNFKSSGIGEPSVYHAMVVIFLEFFAWGLLTMPVISVLNQTFPDQTFLMNGLVMGIKGILSFLSAPLVGALSDIWGRKIFLLITVFFTCAPIPLMTINTWWFFALISISGVFAVTFSVVFAYVADVTTIEERSRAYGLVSATFAASLVISPALGAALMEMYGDTLVVALATAIAVLDVFFILVAVPESLPEKVRPSSWGAPISWEQADPFAALRKVGTDHTILMQCVTVLLSYLPEAGQYSCIFVYLKLKMGFNSMEVAIFIAVVGILSISAQVTLGYLMRTFGAKCTIILGLILEMMQLLWYGFGSQAWMMWAAGILAALGSITYPAISAFVSIHSTPDKQGAVQGMVTGMRGLCNGLGPAMFGVVFYLFNVDLNDESSVGDGGSNGANGQNQTTPPEHVSLVPGPPFAFGALMVVCAILVAIYIPEAHGEISLIRAPSEKKRVSVEAQYEIESGHKSASPLAPLMRSDSLAQL